MSNVKKTTKNVSFRYSDNLQHRHIACARNDRFAHFVVDDARQN